MPMEIERRFRVIGDGWRQAQPQRMKQGFLSVEKKRVVRVRVAGETAWLTVKGMISNLSRHEFEYPIPLADAELMLAQLCPQTIEKNRHRVWVGGHEWEVDEYFGDNAGLVLAELELDHEETDFPLPDWVGEEVTHDGRFTNAHLSQHPYPRWPENLA